jgi:hypothetical protein
MTMNRLITSLVQLALAVPTTILLIAVIKDVKENGLFPEE